MEERPAATLDSRIVHEGRVFDVVRDRVRLPTGRKTVMDVVRSRSSVILIPMPDPGRVVLVRQYRYAVDRWLWELPAGTLEPDEDVESAARRECREETGYAPERIERVGAFYPTPGYCNEAMVFLRLTGLTVMPADRDEDEVLEPKIFTLDDARSLTADDEIGDMKTVLGLSLA